jgi:hypothetical protein
MDGAKSSKDKGKYRRESHRETRDKWIVNFVTWKTRYMLENGDSKTKLTLFTISRKHWNHTCICPFLRTPKPNHLR